MSIVRCRGLPFSCTPDDLRAFFEGYAVEEVYLGTKNGEAQGRRGGRQGGREAGSVRPRVPVVQAGAGPTPSCPAADWPGVHARPWAAPLAAPGRGG